MSELPADLVAGLDVSGVTPVHGGDISRAYRLETSQGPVFCKTHSSPPPRMFEREAAGLAALAAVVTGCIRVPRVLAVAEHGLVLEWIEPGRREDTTEQDLGRGLAAVHSAPAPAFGGLDSDRGGYIGSVLVDLTRTESWPEFYFHRRLGPLVAQAIDARAVPGEARTLLDRLEPRAEELCGPVEAPSLVHGDLWGGNRMVGAGGVNWLIDPAAHYAHREIDLAMMRLFGGFSPDCFAAYDEVFPPATGWRERVAWYQLTPILVHAILFGGSYGAEALAVLRSYA
jgi:fructosamine-3-kinase